MNVEVVVFNYNPQPIGELTVQGRYIGGYYGAFGPGGTGGKSYCCVEVEPGIAEVQWMYGGPEGTPKSGQRDSAKGSIPEPGGEYAYLGVHIYPDRRIDFTLTKQYPMQIKPGNAHE